MIRRHIALLALLVSTFALTACVSPTSPRADDDGNDEPTPCGVQAGSGTCKSN